METNLKKNQTILINVFGHANLGDGALVESCFAICDKANKPIDFGVALYPETEARYINIPWYKRLISKPRKSSLKNILHSTRAFILLLLINLKCPLFFQAFILTKNEKNILEKARDSIVIACPGGYLEDSNPSYVINLLNIILFSYVSKITVLAPMSIGPVNSRLGKYLISIMLKKCDKIFCRETYSLKFATSILPDNKKDNIAYCGDIAFLYKPNTLSLSYAISKSSNKSFNNNHHKSIGITIVSWGFTGSHNPELSKNMYRINMTNLLNYLINEKLFDVTIVNQVQSDIPFSREICKNFQVNLLENERSVSDHLALISTFDFFVGSRFHSCIFSMLTKTPFVCLSYLPKCSEMMNDLDLFDLMLNLYDLNSEYQIKEHVSKFIDDSSLAGRASRSVSNYQEQCKSFGQYLSTIDL